MKEIIEKIREFNEERDWDKFHSPENLAKSISIEAGELLECFQWDSENYNKEEVCEELADVFTYCIQIAMQLNVDPKDIILKKIVIEFKRWNSAKVVTDRDDMVEVKAYGIVQHPSYQALSYAKIVKNFYAVAEEDKMDIIPCSCLHRYEKTENDDITNNQYRSLLEESPIFLNGENDKLKEFISKHIKYGDNKET